MRIQDRPQDHGHRTGLAGAGGAEHGKVLAEQVVGDRKRRQVGGVLERAETHRRGLRPRIDGAQLLTIGGMDRAVQRGMAGHATLEAPAVRPGVQDLAEQADLDHPPVVVDAAPPVVLERGDHAEGARRRALQANERANLHGAGDLRFDHTPDQGTRDRDHPSDAGTGRGVGPGFEPRVDASGRLDCGCRRLGAMIGAVAAFVVGAVRWRWCLRCRLPARGAGRRGRSGPLFLRDGGLVDGNGRSCSAPGRACAGADVGTAGLAGRSDAGALCPTGLVAGAGFAAGGGSPAGAPKIGSRPWRRRARIAAQLRLPSAVLSASGGAPRAELDFLSIKPPAAGPAARCCRLG